MIQKHYIFLTFLLLALGMVLAAGCTTPATQGEGSVQNAPFQEERVEIYHFHLTQQCYSCRVVGAFAEDTVNTYFADELASGKVVFAHVNVDLPENRALVEKYGTTGSSLWIGVYDKNGFHKEQNINVWYKIKNQDEYMVYLKGVIDKRLAGDFS